MGTLIIILVSRREILGPFLALKAWAAALVVGAFLSGCAAHVVQPDDCPAPRLERGTDPCVNPYWPGEEAFSRELFDPPRAAGWWVRATGCFRVVEGEPVIFYEPGTASPDTALETILDHEMNHWAKWCESGDPDLEHKDRGLWQ